MLQKVAVALGLLFAMGQVSTAHAGPWGPNSSGESKIIAVSADGAYYALFQSETYEDGSREVFGIYPFGERDAKLMLVYRDLACEEDPPPKDECDDVPTRFEDIPEALKQQFNLVSPPASRPCQGAFCVLVVTQPSLTQEALVEQDLESYLWDNYYATTSDTPITIHLDTFVGGSSNPLVFEKPSTSMEGLLNASDCDQDGQPDIDLQVVWLTPERVVIAGEVSWGSHNNSCKNFVKGSEAIHASAVTTGLLEQLMGCARTHTGDIHITSKSDLSVLSGEALCLDGSLVVEGSELESLDGLGNVIAVTGDVRIVDNAQLTRLDGLEALTYVGGRFEIHNNPVLASLQGLDALRAVSGAFSLASNPLLQRVSGTRNLRGLGGLVIRDNDALATIEELDQLHTITGALLILDNPALTSIGAFTRLAHAGSHVRIRAPQLFSLGTFKILTRVQGDLELDGFQIPNLKAFVALDAVNGHLVLRNQPKLEHFKGFAKLRFVGSLTLENLASITSLKGFPALAGVKTNLVIASNPELTSLKGIKKGPKRLKGELVLKNNPKLEQLKGFKRLKKVEQALVIEDNPALTRIKDLGLGSVGHLVIRNNPAYPQCKAVALQKWAQNPAQNVVENNDTQASCP